MSLLRSGGSFAIEGILRGLVSSHLPGISEIPVPTMAAGSCQFSCPERMLAAFRLTGKPKNDGESNGSAPIILA
jgi:hypothetical protein